MTSHSTRGSEAIPSAGITFTGHTHIITVSSSGALPPDLERRPPLGKELRRDPVLREGLELRHVLSELSESMLSASGRLSLWFSGSCDHTVTLEARLVGWFRSMLRRSESMSGKSPGNEKGGRGEDMEAGATEEDWGG